MENNPLIHRTSQEKFAYYAAHDLRSPLNRIRQFAEIVLLRGVEDPKQADAIQRIQRIVTEADRILERLLELVHGRELLVDVQPTNWREIARQAWYNVDSMHSCVEPENPMQGSFPNQSPIRGSAKEYVWADAHSLRVIFEVLFDNAIKHGGHTPDFAINVASQPNTLPAYSQSPGNNTLPIYVSNNGPSIDDAYKQKIFEPFFTMSPLTKGAGIGLTIALEHVIRIGGRLRLNTDFPSPGCCFELHLKMAEPP